MPKLEVNEDFELLTEEEEEKKETEKVDNPPTEENKAETEEETEEEFDFDDEESEPEYTLSDIGKVYTLKSIYSSLNSLYNFSDSLIIDGGELNEDLVKIQEQIQQVKDLFLLIAYNIDKYLDKLDTIIDLLKKFVKTTAKELTKYANASGESGKEKNSSNKSSSTSNNKQ